MVIGWMPFRHMCESSIQVADCMNKALPFSHFSLFCVSLQTALVDRLFIVLGILHLSLNFYKADMSTAIMPNRGVTTTPQLSRRALNA